MLYQFGPLFAQPTLYLDPGSGSFLIQILLAAVLGISVAVKMYWTKIKNVLTGKKSDPTVGSDENDDE